MTRPDKDVCSAELLAWAHSGTSRDGLLTSHHDAILAYADALGAANGGKDGGIHLTVKGYQQQASQMAPHVALAVLQAEVKALREALEEIASFKPTYPGDPQSRARAALQVPS